MDSGFTKNIRVTSYGKSGVIVAVIASDQLLDDGTFMLRLVVVWDNGSITQEKACDVSVE
jgi:hypothetical protein